MNVLITGATGFIGRRLVDSLLQENDSVRVVTRDVESARWKLNRRCDFVGCDLMREVLPVSAASGVEAVIHLAGESVAQRWTDEARRRIRYSRVLSTQNLLSAFAQMIPGPRVILSASAIGIYGDRGAEQLTERSRHGRGFLAEVCSEWETHVLQSSPKSRKIITRIGLVLGEQGGALAKLLTPFRLGLGGPMGSGRQWMSWIHLEDLVQSMLFLVRHPEAQGVFNAVSPSPLMNQDFAKALGAALNRPAFIPTPAFALRALMGDMSDMVLASQRVLPENLLKLGFEFGYRDLPSALKNLVGSPHS